jgi:hypothetical protein
VSSDSWWDPAAAWWAKAARARKHVEDALAMAVQYEMCKPYEIAAEPTGIANETAYRFRILKPVPVELQTTAGDAFHNMRSCLDSVAYELAVRHVGNLTEKQQLAAEFPIRATRSEFDDFFRERKVRQDMYGPRERDAMRCVQPFTTAEEAAEYGVEWSTTPAEEYRIHELARLSKLSNIDKHRRLTLVAWYVDLVYWAGPGPTSWHPAPHPGAGLEDSSLLGHQVCEDEGNSSSPPTFDMRLTITDDPGYRQDLASALERLQTYLESWVLPRIFTVAEGGKAPMMIARRIPSD